MPRSSGGSGVPRERQHWRHGPVTVSGCARRAGRSQSAGKQPAQTGLALGRGGAGRVSPDITNERDWLAANEGRGLRAPGKSRSSSDLLDRGSGRGCAPGKGEGSRSSASPAPLAVELGLDGKEGRALRERETVDPPVHGRRAGPAGADVIHWCVPARSEEWGPCEWNRQKPARACKWGRAGAHGVACLL